MMASLEAEVWPVLVAQPELAAEVLACATLAEVTIEAVGDKVIVVGRPLLGRTESAWRITTALAGLWTLDFVPPAVGIAAELAGAVYFSTGELVVAVAEGMDGREWMRRVEITIGG